MLVPCTSVIPCPVSICLPLVASPTTALRRSHTTSPMVPSMLMARSSPPPLVSASRLSWPLSPLLRSPNSSPSVMLFSPGSTASSLISRALSARLMTALSTLSSMEPRPLRDAALALSSVFQVPTALASTLYTQLLPPSLALSLPPPLPLTCPQPLRLPHPALALASLCLSR